MNADQASGIFWIIFSLITMAGSYRLRLGSPVEPGAGFLPFLCSAFMLLMAIIVIAQSVVLKRGLRKSTKDIWEDVRWQRPLNIALIIGGYILLLEVVGFVVSAFLLLLLLLKVIERQSWSKTFMISACTVFVCYWIFDRLLMVSLPIGILGP